jgi:predicted metal-binding membrane protein
VSRRSPAGRERRRIRGPLLATTAGAWVALAASSVAAGPTTAAHDHGSGDGAAIGVVGVVGVALMVVAMVTPLAIEPLREVTQRTVGRVRRRRGALTIAGYLGLWFLAGLVITQVAGSARRVLPNDAVAVVAAVALALAWQSTPLKQRCLNRTHAHSLLVSRAARGDASAVRGGAEHARWCVGSCWPMMLLACVVPASFVAMAATAAWMWAEHLDPVRPPRWRPALPTRVLLTVPARLHAAMRTERALVSARGRAAIESA